jgi:ABC-type glycerol-3-phosphate transport system substrate-binding protein
MKKLIGILLCMVLTTALFVGCGTKETQETVQTGEGEKASSEKETTETTKDTLTETAKPLVKVYGKVIEYTSGPMMTDALTEMLKDKYVIDAIQVDWANQDTVIRTGIASGDPCDLYNYTPSGMVNFLDMSIDLKPYLDADPEWKAQFSDTALAAGTYDGKILNVPWEQNFPIILANKTVLDELGIVIPDKWTFEEFSVVADKIKAAGYYPLANASDQGRATWIYRNAMLSEVVSEGKGDEFAAGTLSITGDEALKALEAVKSLYDNDYMYPGQGAVTVKNDECKVGFYQGDALMMSEIAAGAKNTAGEADFEVVTVPWPSSGSVEAINGVYNGFFIPMNVKDVDVAVDVLKAFTSTEIQTIHGAEGYIPANVNVEITDPFVNEVLSRSTAIAADYPYTIEEWDYLRNGLLPDLILNGGVDTVIEQLKALEQQ